MGRCSILSLAWYHPLVCWVRDLTEEGIESHPGPARYISKNINGVRASGKLYTLLKSIDEAHKKEAITAVFIQEHNLSATDLKEHSKIARGLNLLWIAAYAPAKAATGISYGGTAIVIPFSSITLESGETNQETAIKRINSSQQKSASGRLVSAYMSVDGKKRKLISAYAPARNTKQENRKDFFNNFLSRRATKNTVLGIDANCVPDTELDLRRDANTPYENSGRDELEEIIHDKNLLDVAREFLGTDNPTPFFTSHHIAAEGKECYSRIDRIYVPDDDQETWQHETAADFFPHPEGRKEIDHAAVFARTEKIVTKRGTDVQFINEEIYNDATFNEKIAVMIRAVLSNRLTTRTEEDEKWIPTWEEIKEQARKMSLAETQRKKYSESAAIKIKKCNLKQLRALI